MARDFKHLKFGVNIHTGIRPDVDPVTVALHAEQLGFDMVTLHEAMNHFHNMPSSTSLMKNTSAISGVHPIKYPVSSLWLGGIAALCSETENPLKVDLDGGTSCPIFFKIPLEQHEGYRYSPTCLPHRAAPSCKTE